MAYTLAQRGTTLSDPVSVSGQIIRPKPIEVCMSSRSSVNYCRPRLLFALFPINTQDPQPLFYG